MTNKTTCGGGTLAPAWFFFPKDKTINLFCARCFVLRKKPFIEENSIEFSSIKLEYFAPEGGKNSTLVSPTEIFFCSYVRVFRRKTRTSDLASLVAPPLRGGRFARRAPSDFCGRKNPSAYYALA